MFNNDEINELFQIMFGEGVTMIVMFGYMWFFIIGYFIYGLTETSGRDKESRKTPKKWSWRFWFRDNWRRYLTTVLCTYILFRFYTEISGHPFGNFDAVTLGLLGDGISATLKKRVKGLGNNQHRHEYMSENYDNYNDECYEETHDECYDENYHMDERG